MTAAQDSPAEPPRPHWWQQAIGYEVYIRSFADGSGDGLGDVRGIIDRLDHLTWLGVTVLWITPFYPSPGHDAGYDVADYRDVDPAFGVLADIDELIARAHDRSLRVIVDLVPNHTSDEHRWFRASRSSRDDPYRDWYIWRDGKGPGEPPNNWVSVFGGPAWSWDEATGQWWHHGFLPEQPDLNWQNPEVRNAFDDIIRFWVERGVDGFRIDCAHQLAKHPELPDLPLAEDPPTRNVGTSMDFLRYEHLYDRDQDAVLDIYRRWRRLVAPVDRGVVLLGEVFVHDPERMNRYVRDDDGLHASFWFPLQAVGWEAPALRESIRDGLRAGTVRGAPGAGLAWALDSHDQDRSASRFGGGERGRRRSLALTALLTGLPGVPFLYQGQELALPDGEVGRDDVQDPIARRLGEYERGRDPARTPMPWSPGDGMGFCPTGVEPWLPFGGREPHDTVELQAHESDSWLSATRDLLAVRGSSSDLDLATPLEWIDGGGDVLAYRRGDTVVAVNCGDGAETVAHGAPGSGRLLWATPGGGAAVGDGRLRLEPDHAAIVEAF